MENGNGDVFWNVERCTKGGREQYEFVTKMDNFPLFEFHCNIAKQLIKCESFHCKYTMLFQLPVCIYIYIYVCIYACISIIWNFYPGYVKSWLEQIYFPIREYAICWKFSIYFFFFFSYRLWSIRGTKQAPWRSIGMGSNRGSWNGWWQVGEGSVGSDERFSMSHRSSEC